jgi:hypothetical protein
MITKKVQRSEDLYIQFTDEELKSLNIEPGDKFSWEIENESLVLKKFVSLDVDISEWSREVLEMLIVESVEKDVSVNDVICNILDKYLPKKDV